MKNLIKSSKYLSKLLRHNPEELEISNDGYIKVTHILKKLNITQEELDIIVNENDKKRFEYKGHKEYIKARQGHSNDEITNIELIEVTEPIDLYHGTSFNLINSITKDGLMKMSRHHVHFTNNYDLAVKRANTQAKSNKSSKIIFKLDTKKWLNDGNKLFKSNNDVYLTDNVPFEYLTIEYKITVDGKSDEEKLNELVEKYKR